MTTQDAVSRLKHNDSFQQVQAELWNMREQAIYELTREETVENHAKVAASIGELRALNNLCGLLGIEILSQQNIDTRGNPDETRGTEP